MNDKYSWLPPLILFSDYDGAWEPYCEELYKYFRHDFLDSHAIFQGKPIKVKFNMYRGKEETFWHLTHERPFEGEFPAFNRCERLRWVRSLIENVGQGRAIFWPTIRRTKSGKDNRIVISLDDFSYVVILCVRRNYFLLWTAYPVDELRKRTFRNEYQKYIESQKN